MRAGLHSCLNHSQGYVNQGQDNRPIPTYILTLFHFLCFSFSHVMSWQISDFLPELPQFFLAFSFGVQVIEHEDKGEIYPRTEKAEIFLFISTSVPVDFAFMPSRPHILNVDSRIKQSNLHVRLELTSLWFVQNIFSLMFCRKNLNTQCQTALGVDRNQTLPSLDHMRFFPQKQ